jgi:hypothetical protein
MLTTLFEQVFVESGAAASYSRAAEVPPDETALHLSIVGAAVAAGATIVTLQESNDLENWTASPTGPTLELTSTTRYASGTATSVAARYVRAKVVASGGNAFVSARVASAAAAAM